MDVTKGETKRANSLKYNDIGDVQLSTSAPIFIEPEDNLGDLARFILIDRYSYATLGAGIVSTAGSETQRKPGHEVECDGETPPSPRPACVWLTGLSGAGKTTIASIVLNSLRAQGRCVSLLDGDRIRHGLSRDLSYSNGDRAENMRRVAEVARLMCDAGVIVIVSLISPFTSERRLAREIVGDGFIEVFVDTPLALCEERDVKGLYARARRGDIKDFTGIDSPYERPSDPDVVIATTGRTPEECARQILRYIDQRPSGRGRDFKHS